MEELHDIIAVGGWYIFKDRPSGRPSGGPHRNLKDIKQYITRIDEIIHRKELKMI